MNANEVSVEKSCFIGAALEMIQAAYAPFGLKGADEADLFELHRKAYHAIHAYADALYLAGLISLKDRTSDNAASACRHVVKAIAQESHPKSAEWRDERTYATHLAREAAKTKATPS